MARRWRRAAVTAAGGALALAVGSAGLPAAGAAGAEPGGTTRAELGGTAALRSLGDRLPEVARAHGLTTSRLAAILATDPTARVDRSGGVLFKDPLPAGRAKAAPPVARGPYPQSQTFLLHSRPGASRIIVLDFDGYVVSGTAWNSNYGISSTQVQPPFDADGDPATFSAAEHDVIQAVWQQVAEDFAALDVDVTTQDPGDAVISRTSNGDSVYGTRVLVSPAPDAWVAICNSACGGVAYLSMFNRVGNQTRYPAWVFSAALLNSPKKIAEAATHEAGHNLGLSHDGTSALGYYRGHANWAPIMGVGYDRPVSQWSQGEYTGANNRQNDFSVMSSFGLSARADDHGSTRTAARVLTAPGSTAGIIATRTDLDVFRIRTTCTGPVTAAVTPAPTAPNLDVRLRLLSSTGSALVVADPPSGMVDNVTATGLDAAVSTSLAAGTYYLEVDGVGIGTGATGYTDYGSLGAYTLTVGGCLA